MLPAHGALTHSVLQISVRCSRDGAGEGERGLLTLRGGQSSSFGKVTVNLMAPQRQPPEMLSGRVIAAVFSQFLNPNLEKPEEP